ncbi:DUF4386 domain-containing protein [Cryobacterium sp.]|jgi:hypothetical protein|uniref:DUF4386 domain-containing protein n=1 Tax=Cryobacterium sp. TaxID=1926290 RepID=UPI00260952DB|nr:DUF4386 domain-containing protein [Cryobacterium sp.]MCU1445776.1 hypothetical protein [Cryobacterium sp.]
MTDIVAAAVLLIVLPLVFNALFAALAISFDYPDILRRPTAEVLSRFRRGGSRLVLLWWAFAMTPALLAVLAGLLPAALWGADATVLSISTIVGVLAGLVQFLGLIRWPFLVPYLARVLADQDAPPGRKQAVDVVFQAFHRYLGVAVGEHLGLLFTGAWSMLIGTASIQSYLLPDWLGIVGIVVGTVLALCSFEFVGSFENHGWPLAARLTPMTYIVWSLWLVATGVALLL